ncbi:hypothetical protein SVI_3180 [Shewanella violacea DSS12]|uniref:Uncharacterized protein n=1 Tax=Shewanella violacea (strain JCM 10179 / CIP 106290 / LMG 19151 / DSS12) TaxID=637905 RepID=D4ZAV6_SHEVD|nr:hypothetical protein SVI_3180 [Shewanella violacea DSS12]
MLSALFIKLADFISLLTNVSLDCQRMGGLGQYYYRFRGLNGTVF